MAYNDIPLIPNFVKLGLLVQKLKGNTHMQIDNIIELLFSS